ncbi:actin interacting protein 3-domain-containing protein [Amylostereum chailletii]|nr:actin interacting protein 3-domain-containing protein [Amylostereum chailletii]
MASQHPGSHPTHPSRQDNQSVSSVRSDRSARSRPNPAVESAVTRLLVAIKQLLETLTEWNKGHAEDNDVSDVYVRLGNDFNAAVAAFASYNIHMTELLGVPDELRAVLEDCLSEEPKNLDKYLPKVRAIITGLLEGLRGKQSLFRQIVSGNRHRSDASAHSRTDSSGRVSRSDRSSSRRDTKASVAEDSARRNTQSSVASSSSSSRRREHTSSNGADAFVGGFSPDLAHPVPSRSSSFTPDRPPSTRPPPKTPPPPPLPPLPTSPETDATPTPPQRTSQVPASVKRYSLVDAPLPPPAVVIDEPSPSETPPDEHPDRGGSLSPAPEPVMDTPGVASSLAALKQSDALERRASKRFSTYNISKMTGLPRERSVGASGHPNRRSLAASNALTAGELAVLTEADEEPGSRTPSPKKRERSRSTARTKAPPPLEDISEERPPPVPPLPREEPGPKSLPRAEEPSPPPPPPPGPMTVFLQVGREVKKARMEPGLSFSSLRVMFVERFAYNPGQGNFPAIYIRDPSSGVQYELEDMDEVKDKCLLSLNIEPLDQIKEYIDTQISGLSQELRDLRKAVTENRRASVIMPAPAPEIPSSPPAPRPSDHQLRNVARRLSRLVNDHPPPAQPILPQMTGPSLQPQMTGASVMSEYSNRIVIDLKTQFDEVQNLRRDLGIMRQLYTEFMTHTKDSLGTLRAQTTKVREMAANQVPGARAYIDEGKTKLDMRSQNALTKMEELQDTVEQVKDDVLKRHISPKPHVLKAIKDDIDTVAAELESLKEHIKTIKPMWKKTWEEELQSIVEEQQFLNHQEEFLADLLEDQKAVVEVYGHVEKVISLRGAAGSRGARARSYRPPPPDEGHNGLSTVMLEIKGAAVDPDKRMKAIAANQKNRERELAARSDEFQSELQGFVGQKKLKMTGGAEETERVRQKRNDMTLKAMFNQPPPGASSSPTSPSLPSPAIG